MILVPRRPFCPKGRSPPRPRLSEGARKERTATDPITSTTHGEEETMAKAKAKGKVKPPKKVPFGGYQVWR